MRSVLSATLLVAAIGAFADARLGADDAALDRGRQAEGGDDRPDPPCACRPRPIPPKRWRRRSGWRCNRTSPGSGSITARSRAKSASAWSPRSRNSRRAAAPRRPACSTRRSAASWPTPPGGGRKMPAGRSSPTPAPACGSASRQNWCRIGERRQRHQMDLADRHHPDRAVAAQGGQPDHGQTRRTGEEGGRPQHRLHRGQAGLFRAVGPAGPEEVLYARHFQRRRGPHPHHPLRPGGGKHRRADRDRDVERIQRRFRAERRPRVRRRGKRSNTAPASWSARTAPSSPTVS